MLSMNGRSVVLCLSIGIVAGLGNRAMAGSHTWRVVELFSNADGSVQFIEMTECCGGQFEVGINGHLMTSSATGHSFTIPGASLTPPTSFKRVLLATPAFAALPGAPTPNYTIPAGFFATTGDSVSYTPWDTFTFGAGALPTDGIHSLNRDFNTNIQTVACNTPTNYAGQTATVNVGCSLPGDVDGSGTVDGSDIAAFVRAKLGTPDPADHPGCAEYCTGSLD